MGSYSHSVRPFASAPGKAHCVHVGEASVYRLWGDPRNWDTEKNPHGQAMLDLWTQYAPNLNDSVMDWFTRSALDTERTFPNMQEGDLLVGAFANGQIGYNRPFPGAGHYRGHIPGLYLCGACCHPGGNITGLIGYNCAQVLLNDLGVPANWAPQLAERILEKL